MYVALGDSISRDDYAGGPGRGGASLLARGDDESVPPWSGRDLRSRGVHAAQVLATDGATSWSVLHEQVPRPESLSPRPSVVTLTAGGNDVLLCFGDTRAAMAAVRTVTTRLGEVLERLRSLDPDAVVAVGTVYDPSDGTGDAARLALPPWPDAVRVIGQLDDALRGMAGAHGIRLADIHGRFLGHGLSAGDVTQPVAPGRRQWAIHVRRRRETLRRTDVASSSPSCRPGAPTRPGRDGGPVAPTLVVGGGPTSPVAAQVVTWEPGKGEPG